MHAKNPPRMAVFDPGGGVPINVAQRHYGVRSGLRGMIAEWQLSWHERHHAARASKELLALYRAAAARHPELPSRELYQLVVMQRMGCDSMSAKAILESAQEAYADWPARHQLTLCDVVHYLSATEFLASHQGELWIHSNMAKVIALHVPHDLCIARKAN